MWLRPNLSQAWGTIMKYNILLVDDDPGMIQVLARVLSGLGSMRFATDGETALAMARESVPDLVLLDAEMPNINGYKVCQTMKATPELADVPVIFITSHAHTDYEVAALALGAADFISKPICEPLLLARVKTQLRLKQAIDELRRISTVDALTEISNRRRFDELLEREWQRSLRASNPLALLLMDIDHFKLFNDRYGHPAGDACLHSVAAVLRDACMRPADDVARIGGEEFALLLPQTTLAGAEKVARRVMAGVESLAIPHESSPTAGHVTVSVGLAYFGNNCVRRMPHADPRFDDGIRRHDNASDLVKCADQALYAAKRAGRSQAWRLAFDNVNVPDQARKIARLHLAVPLRETA
jgi:diguanylate cyclase (GGDEF)-like protein